MPALVLDAPGHMAMRRDKVPTAREGEAMVATARVGICGSDLHAFYGRHPAYTYPRRFGHELAVRVIHANSLETGQLCAVNPYLCCGKCAACRRQLTNCCENLRVMGIHCDGGAATYMVVPEVNLHTSPLLSAEILALVEPLVVGRHAVRRAGLTRGEPVVVVGAGPIGLVAAIFVRDTGAKLALVEAREDRRRMAEQILGLEDVFPPGPELKQRLRACFTGVLPHAVLEATGNAESMQASYDLAGPGGRLVLVGIVPNHFSFPDPDFHRRELTIMASRNGTPEDFRHVMRRLEAGLPEVEKLITHRIDFDEVPDIMSKLGTTPNLIKAMVQMPDWKQ